MSLIVVGIVGGTLALSALAGASNVATTPPTSEAAGTSEPEAPATTEPAGTTEAAPATSAPAATSDESAPESTVPDTAGPDSTGPEPAESTEPATPPDGASVSDHSQVIAQGVVDFSASQFAWAATQEQATQAGDAVDAPGSQFVLAADGTILVSNGVGQVLLDPGEATFDPVILAATITATDADTATYWAIRLSAGEFEASDTTIEPGAGPRDVNLVRDVLAPGQSLSIASENPQFLLVTSGAVAAAGTDVAAGESTAIVAGSSITNTGSEPAVVVLAVIGAAVAASAPPATTG